MGKRLRTCLWEHHPESVENNSTSQQKCRPWAQQEHHWIRHHWSKRHFLSAGRGQGECPGVFQNSPYTPTLSWLWTSKFTSQGPAVLIWAIRGTDPLVPYYSNTLITLTLASEVRKVTPVQSQQRQREGGILRSGATRSSPAVNLTGRFADDKPFCKESVPGKLCRPIQPPVPSAQEEEPKRWTWVLRESRESLLGDRRTEEFQRAALPT